MTDRLRELAQIPLFAALDPAERRAIGALARTKTYDAGSQIFSQGDAGGPMFAVLSGHLKVIVPGLDGNEVVFTIMGRGEVFGELSVLDGAPRSASVIAISPAEVLVIDREPFLAFVRASPDTAIKLLKILVARIRRLSDDREQMVSLDVSARLAKKLTDLVATYGEPSEAGDLRISIRISQRDLGAWIGTTRETVNKFLRRWTRQGLLRFEAGHIVVTDVRGLKGLTTPDRPPGAC
jgi:CRP/FNR family cyclic AMP-dependent transcriptional regulator